MDLVRISRHLMTGSWQARRAFSRATLRSIERTIGESEQSHAGEIRFAVEATLPLSLLLSGHSSRERAVELFSRLRIWDTEHNNGVLVYVLLADRAVEIVADRGINAKIAAHEWEAVCNDMRLAYGRGEFKQGSVAGLEAIARHLSLHFAAGTGSLHELPDAPVVL